MPVEAFCSFVAFRDAVIRLYHSGMPLKILPLGAIKIPGRDVDLDSAVIFVPL